MRNATRVALATVLAAAIAAGCSGGDGGDREGTAGRRTPAGSFVGTVAGSGAYVAVVVGADGDALAHVTDGQFSVDWLDGRLRGRTATLTNEGGAIIDAQFDGNTVTGSFRRPREAALEFTARRGQTPAGLYRAVADFPDGRYVGGWVVLPDATERGTVRRYETPLMPGEVDATIFTPGDTTFTVPGGVLRPELVRPSSTLALPN
jgi:hypothetical protein